MSPRHKTTIPQMVADGKHTAESAFVELGRHLKSAVGDPYNNRQNYLTVIMDRNTKTVDLIAQIKVTQWRVVNYAVLLVIAVTGAVQLVRMLIHTDWYKIALSAFSIVTIALVYIVAKTMMDKIESDLAFCREHTKLNEEMMNLTTGIQLLANRVVSLRKKDLAPKHNFEVSALENRNAFTIWLYAIILGSSVVACLVSQLLIWTA
jgi:hypothetical protein